MRPHSRSLAMLACGHACVDVYQGSVAALVPFLVAERAYAYATAAGVVLAASLLSSLVQPLFGALTDRWETPWLLPVSTVVSGAGVALAGVTGTYPLTLAAVALSGVGVAAYHPEAARVARRAAGRSHRAMGWFSLGGNVGFATSPLLVGAVVACRSIVFVGLSAFVSLLASQRVGGGLTGSAALFTLYLGGAVGTVAGGSLAARFGRLAVTRWSYALTVVAVAGVVLVPGPLLFVFVALASAGLYVPFSLHITLGQDYLPRHAGTASGITLGLTVTVGGLASPAIGALADATSLPVALAPLIALPAVGWLLLRPLREPASVLP